jgi:hypothetical protein
MGILGSFGHRPNLGNGQLTGSKDRGGWGWTEGKPQFAGHRNCGVVTSATAARLFFIRRASAEVVRATRFLIRRSRCPWRLPAWLPSPVFHPDRPWIGFARRGDFPENRPQVLMCQRFASSEDWLRFGTFPPLRPLRRDPVSSLATGHWSLITRHSSLAAIRCLPTDIAHFTRTTHRPPPTAHCSPPTAHRSLLTVVPKSGSFSCSIPPSFVLSCNRAKTNIRAIWLRSGAFLTLLRSLPVPSMQFHWPLVTGHWPHATPLVTTRCLLAGIALGR